MRLAGVGIVERLKDLEDSAGALDDVAAVAHLLGTCGDRGRGEGRKRRRRAGRKWSRRAAGMARKHPWHCGGNAVT